MYYRAAQDYSSRMMKDEVEAMCFGPLFVIRQSRLLCDCYYHPNQLASIIPFFGIEDLLTDSWDSLKTF